ncbi:hypothetical protein ACJX0J_014208, partial [Zea mays]
MSKAIGLLEEFYSSHNDSWLAATTVPACAIRVDLLEEFLGYLTSTTTTTKFSSADDFLKGMYALSTYQITGLSIPSNLVLSLFLLLCNAHTSLYMNPWHVTVMVFNF